MNWLLKVEVLKKFRYQADLAQRVGVDEPRLSRIIRGRTFPTPEEREAIARNLGVSEGELWPGVSLSE